MIHPMPKDVQRLEITQLEYPLSGSGEWYGVELEFVFPLEAWHCLAWLIEPHKRVLVVDSLSGYKRQKRADLGEWKLEDRSGDEFLRRVNYHNPKLLRKWQFDNIEHKVYWQKETRVWHYNEAITATPATLALLEELGRLSRREGVYAIDDEVWLTQALGQLIRAIDVFWD